jgi:hypothetical protein
MKYLPIDKNLFIENRKKFVQQLKPNCLSIFVSNDIFPKSADATFDLSFDHFHGPRKKKAISLLHRNVLTKITTSKLVNDQR